MVLKSPNRFGTATITTSAGDDYCVAQTAAKPGIEPPLSPSRCHRSVRASTQPIISRESGFRPARSPRHSRYRSSGVASFFIKSWFKVISDSNIARTCPRHSRASMANVREVPFGQIRTECQQELTWEPTFTATLEDSTGKQTVVHPTA